MAIAHPRPNTIAFLGKALPHLEALGVELVPISVLTAQPPLAEPAGLDVTAVSAP